MAAKEVQTEWAKGCADMAGGKAASEMMEQELQTE